MENCYIESIIYHMALGIKALIDKGIITKNKKIVLYGLDIFSFAARTILSNMGFEVDSYISDSNELLIKYKRQLKMLRSRYLNSSRDLIRIDSIEDRLYSFDEDIIILNGLNDCPIAEIEKFHYQRNVNFFQIYDWERDDFAQSMQKKRKMTLSEVQETQKEILCQVDRFCRKKELRYWVCGGTLLGVMRHKGFIPWDDDIDIFMPWQDYQRFLAEFSVNGKLSLIIPNAFDRRNYCELFSKVIDNRTIVREDSVIIRKIHPIAVDVFPLIGVPEEAGERLLFFEKYYELEKTIWEDFYAGNGDLGVYNKWYPAQREFLEKYDFDKSDYVGVLATAYKEKDCTTRKVYDSTLRMPFEDIEVNVPIGYKEYLDNLYGKDWMELPEESKRVSHHNMEAYWL